MGCKVSRAEKPQKAGKNIQTVPQNTTIAAKPQVLFVLGGPGSGKGTVCDQLVKKCGFAHLSTGDLARKEQEEHPESDISKLMKEGKLISSDMMVDLIRKAIKSLPTQNAKILLDGFPRSQENIDVWASNKMEEDVNVKFCLFLECSHETMEQRIMERAKTSGRADDNPESIKKRLDTFENQTRPIVEFYEKAGKLVKINAETDPDTVFLAVLKAFEEHGFK